MRSITQSLAARGGTAATHELYEDGHTRATIAQAVRTKQIYRVRQGWYVPRGTHPTLLQALRVGGPATCLTALKLQGFWVPEHVDLHVLVHPNACRLRSRSNSRRHLSEVANALVTAHWRVSGSTNRLMLPPLESLVDLLGCQPPEMVMAVADSILHEHPELLDSWYEFLASVPAVHRQYLEQADGVCESGTETLTWWRLRKYHLAIRRQVQISKVGRVDFLIGERLVIEVDGLEYHADPVRFENDRRRDAQLSRLGYRVLRFSYRQVIDSWDDVEAAILAAVLRGDHH